MIHLITVVGKSAREIYLKRQFISDFKSLTRTITSGRVLIVSTKFRSDLFYWAEKRENKAIFKLWLLYTSTNMNLLHRHDFITFSGDEKALSNYFQSINKLSENWFHYKLYKKAFKIMLGNDQNNPVAQTVMLCDQYISKHPAIKRTPLTDTTKLLNHKLTKDTFSLAMRIINDESHSN